MKSICNYPSTVAIIKLYSFFYTHINFKISNSFKDNIFTTFIFFFHTFILFVTCKNSLLFRIISAPFSKTIYKKIIVYVNQKSSYHYLQISQIFFHSFHIWPSTDFTNYLPPFSLFTFHFLSVL